MIEKLLVWKIYSTADVFGVISYVSENGRRAFSSAMLFRGGNWKLFRITYNKTDSKMNQNKS